MYVRADGARVREEQGSTAREIAERAGISPSTLRRVEGSWGPVRVDTVHGIGRALATDPHTFARAISRQRAKQA